MRRPLMFGVRQAGATAYRFVIYGQPGSRFPPAQLETSLRGFGEWLGIDFSTLKRGESGRKDPLIVA